MEHFTPLSAAVGGLLIGISASVLWLSVGRIAGISGILGALWTPQAGEIAWRVAFLIGLIVAPLVYASAGGAAPRVTVSVSPLLLVAGGLLVGFGTRLGLYHRMVQDMQTDQPSYRNRSSVISIFDIGSHQRLALRPVPANREQQNWEGLCAASVGYPDPQRDCGNNAGQQGRV